MNDENRDGDENLGQAEESAGANGVATPSTSRGRGDLVPVSAHQFRQRRHSQGHW